MRLSVAWVVVVIACGKSNAPPAAGSVNAEPRVLMPPGLGAKVELPPPVDSIETRRIEPRRFRHSSVRGDFRVYRTAAGLLASWYTRLSARTLDGKPLWKREGQGRAVAISPDGAKLVTINDAGELLVLDAKTGQPFGAAMNLGGGKDGVWILAFAWLPDGKHILAIDSQHVFLLRGDGTQERELKLTCKEECFFMSAAAPSNDEAIVTNVSSGQLMRIKIADGKTVGAADYYGHDVDLAADGTVFITDDSNGVALFDTATLKPRWSVEMPGYRGVSATTRSLEVWKSMPKLSPSGKYVAVNDHAGRLWVLDARDGKPLIAYSTELIDFIEDVMWLDDATLIALDNVGHVLRLAGTPPRVVWSEMDAPEDAKWDGP